MLAPKKLPSGPCLLPARWAAATARRPTGLSERRSSRRLWPSGASFVLPDNDGVAFLKVSGDDLGYAAIGDARSNEAEINCLVGGQNPDGLPLPSWTATLATGGSLTTLAAVASLPLTLTRRSRSAFGAGTLTFSARSLASRASLTETFTVAVALAAFASLTETFSVAVALAAFASLAETFTVAVALASFTPLTPGFAVEVALAALASLTETFTVAVALAAFTSLTEAFTIAVALSAFTSLT
jgi:hypothetical protein